MSDQGDGIFREIDEEVRRDQLIALWKRYGRLVVSALIAIVLGVLGYQLWRNHVEERLERQSALYEDGVAAAADMAPEAAAAHFAQLAGRLEGGYARLATMRHAGALAEAGDIAAAADLYRAVAETAESPLLAAYARYLAGAALLEAEGPDAAIAMLAPLSGDPASPLYYSALELLGTAHLAAGDREAARASFSAIADDPAAPPALRQRAEDLLAAIPEAAGAEQAPAAPANGSPQP